MFSIFAIPISYTSFAGMVWPNPWVNSAQLTLGSDAAVTGGGIARKARLELENQTGRSVVSAENALPPMGKPRKSLKAINHEDDEPEKH